MSMFAIWLLPQKNDIDYLNEIIETLSSRYNAPRFFPHVTVYGLVSVEIALLAIAVKESVKEISPFVVKKLSIEHSDNIWKSIFVRLTMNKDFLQINRKLVNILSRYTDYYFDPHFSLLYKKLEEFERKKIAKEVKVKNEFVLDKIAIMKHSEDVKKWKILESYDLSAGKF